MTGNLLALAGLPGQVLPPGANAADQAFAYGAVVLLIVLIAWQSRSSRASPSA